MGAKWKHFKTVCKHKAVVFKQCRECGLFWRGLVHDMSKFSPTEFASSARYFQGDKSPIEAEKAETGYSAAWMHHKGHNPHHWEYWIDFNESGNVVTYKIPYKYVVEMVCDWIGAGMVYNGEQWTQSSPMDYYKQVREGRHFHPRTEELIIKFLKCIRDHGLDEFHKMAKCQSPYSYLAIDYEDIYCP
jgi:hypothetical protein